MPSLGERLLPTRARRTLRPVVRSVRYLGLRADDVLLASYPRSGSTWLRFLIAHIITGEPQDWPFVNRFIPDAGKHRRAPGFLPTAGRLVKTHDRAVGPCRRGAYLARDVRDVTLSEYRLQLRGGSSESLDHHLRLAVGGPGGLFGTWKQHVEFWLDTELYRRGDLHVLRYEDLRADTLAVLTDLLAFLDVRAEPRLVAEAIEGNSLSRMRELEDRSVNRGVRRFQGAHRFVGQGRVMGWREQLTPDQRALVEASTGDALRRLGYPVASCTS